LVNAEIVSPYCERKQIGENRFVQTCSNISKWMKDERGEWQDFNKVVSFGFDDSDREFVTNWKGKSITIEPFAFHNGRKTYFRELSPPIWTQLNVRDYSIPYQHKYKFGFELNRISNLSQVGYEVTSTEKLTEIDENRLWFKFGEVGVGFWDLIDNGFKTKYRVEKNKVIVFVYTLPVLDRIDFEPEITQEDDYDNEVQKRRRFTEFGYATDWTCNPSALNPWRVGFNFIHNNNRKQWRSFWEWNTLSIPSNATIEDVDAEYEVIAITNGPDSHIMECTSKPSQAGSCRARFELIDTSTTYVTINSWMPIEWKSFDLGDDAVDELQSHLDWFATGLKFKTEIGGQHHEVGLGNKAKHDGANLIVTYSVPAVEDEEVYIESWLENKIRKGEVHETQEGFWEILLVALGGLGGITLFLTRLI
jgi:hypothetical protein